MALALRRDVLAQDAAYKRIAEEQSRKRACFDMTCSEKNCETTYLIFHGPEWDEGETRKNFEPLLQRDHPQHARSYGMNEPSVEERLKNERQK